MNLNLKEKIINPIEGKIREVERHLIFTGVVFLILAFLVAGTDFMVRFLIGAIVLMLSYVCFFLAYKLSRIKKEIFKRFE